MVKYSSLICVPVKLIVFVSHKINRNVPLYLQKHRFGCEQSLEHSTSTMRAEICTAEFCMFDSVHKNILGLSLPGVYHKNLGPVNKRRQWPSVLFNISTVTPESTCKHLHVIVVIMVISIGAFRT